MSHAETPVPGKALDVVETNRPGPVIAPQRTPTLAEKLHYAEALAQADMLPQAYRRKPGNVLIAIEYAEMLGLAPVVALSHIAVVEGKPSMSAELMRSRVLDAGHRFDILENTAEVARVRITRADGRSAPFEATFTIGDAKRANLVAKNNWQHYPASMLLARATSAAVRAVCPDVSMGISYVPEELGAEVDGEGNVISVASTHTPEPPEEPAGGPDPDMPLARAAVKGKLWKVLGGREEDLANAKRAWNHFFPHDPETVQLAEAEQAVGALETHGLEALESERRPTADVERAAEAVKDAARKVFGTGTEEMATQEDLARVRDITDKLSERGKGEMNSFVEELGVGMVPSKWTKTDVAKISSKAAVVFATENMPHGPSSGRPHLGPPPVPDEVLERRGFLLAVVDGLGPEAAGAFQDLLDAAEGNPHKGLPWRRQLDKLPEAWDEVLKEWVQTLKEETEVATTDAPPDYEPDEEPF